MSNFGLLSDKNKEIEQLRKQLALKSQECEELNAKNAEQKRLLEEWIPSLGEIQQLRQDNEQLNGIKYQLQKTVAALHNCLDDEHVWVDNHKCKWCGERKWSKDK